MNRKYIEKPGIVGQRVSSSAGYCYHRGFTRQARLDIFQVDFMKFTDSGSSNTLLPRARIRLGQTAIFKFGVLCFLLVQAPNCVTQRIVGNEFIQTSKGYSFVLPEGNWEKDDEAWRSERDFGYIFARKIPRSRFVRNRRSLSGANRENLNIRTRTERKVEKLLLDMDVGFRHKTHTGKILVGTIIEGSLAKFIKGNFKKTDSELPENLIAGYMKRLRGFYSPKIADPVVIRVRPLPRAGQAYRMEWVEDREFRVLYGLPLYKEFLFISLRVNEKAKASEIEEGLKTLNQLVESIVITATQ